MRNSFKGKNCLLKIFTDGASRGNPGDAAIAFIIEDEKGTVLEQHNESIGVATNNVAEYTAIIKALKRAAFHCKDQIKCFSDSELFVKQMNGEYKVKKGHLKELYSKVKVLEKKFKLVTYFNLPREDPKIAKVDKLANRALDRMNRFR